MIISFIITLIADKLSKNLTITIIYKVHLCNINMNSLLLSKEN